MILPQQPLQPHWPQQLLKPHFLKKLLDPDGLNNTGTKITNIGHFLWNGSSKTQFFTNIAYPFWQRLLRLCEVKKSLKWLVRHKCPLLRNPLVFGRYIKDSGLYIIANPNVHPEGRLHCFEDLLNNVNDLANSFK